MRIEYIAEIDEHHPIAIFKSPIISLLFIQFHHSSKRENHESRTGPQKCHAMYINRARQVEVSGSTQ